MIDENEQQKINRDYAEYLVEAEQMAAEGKAIGTFLAWSCLRGKNTIKVERRGVAAAAARAAKQ